MSAFQPPPPGYGSAYRPPTPPTPYDGVSIAAFVCALTCCAAPVAIGLGIAGIVRTAGARRRGRWMAVSGLVIGLVATVVGAALTIGLIVLGANSFDTPSAVPGDCLDVTHAFDGTDYWGASCYGPHDGEIVAAGTLGREGAAKAAALSEADWCKAAVPDDVLTLLKGGEFTLGMVTDAWDPTSPEAGDSWFCYAERTDGTRLYGPLDGSWTSPQKPIDT
ncbi:hypothetical protein [Nocardioides jejuensis]|uniref:DUF4190 domain-containing protein n=1 Tax=Nocardioides jejuensis TaxID=2502782 RepID=A0A4R1CGM6_9ACTN|nr:hypothetical protein [Nocardioides jejuensis]TCJ30091.1 hypothetical protein EPD65_05800 [Nocardioides jejuensis]